MGHPLNGFDYVIKEWDFLKERYPYYGFFLFTQDNYEFSKFYDKYFLELDRLSGDTCLFFGIAEPPEGWESIARNRDYWKHYIANSSNDIVFDKWSVYQAARFFQIPRENLPSLVLFKDIKDQEFIVIDFSEIPLDLLKIYVFNIFLMLENKRIQHLRKLWVIKKVLQYIPYNRQIQIREIEDTINMVFDERERFDKNRHTHWDRDRKIRKINFTASQIEVPRQIEKIISSLLIEIEELHGKVNQIREESNYRYNRLDQRLERLEGVLMDSMSRIDSKRRPLLNEVIDLELKYGIEDSEEFTIPLHQKFDEELIKNAFYLAQRVPIDNIPPFPMELEPIRYLLERESIDIISTSEILWVKLQEFKSSNNIDYSVCGVGLWTALEVELNRVFVDALRVINELVVAGIASTKQPVEPKNEKIKEDGAFGSKIKAVILNDYEDIRSNPTNLKGLTLGPCAALIGGAKINRLNQLIPRIETTDIRGIYDLLVDLAKEIELVRIKYRNKYAHIQKMDKDIYEEFRHIVMDSSKHTSPLFATIKMKEKLGEQALI